MLITPAYAAIFALLFFFLSIRTIRQRRRARVAVGSGGDATLERAARVHANFAEYVPFTLVLIYFLEIETAGNAWVHGLCIALLAGRLLHAYGVSQVRENFRFRVAGMILTFSVILSAAFRLLYAYASVLVV